MPLTPKGEEIKGAMSKEYGPEKGERVFYASRNKGTISGVDRGDAEKAKGKKDEGEEQEAQDPTAQLEEAEQSLEALEREQEQAEEGQERQNAIKDHKKMIRGLRDEIKSTAREALTRAGASEERKDALDELEAKEDADKRFKMVADMVNDACERMDAIEAKHKAMAG